MPAPSRRLLRVLGALLLVALSLSAKGTTPLDGCANQVTAPDHHLPRSPEQVVRAVEWAFDNRSLGAYRELLTADFLLTCAGTDSAGSGSAVWTREDELALFARLVDVNRAPALRELSLDLDPDLVVTDDPRPGYTGSGYHALIRSGYTLQFAEGSRPATTVTGQLQFFVVRADTADIPEDRANRATSPDPRVWYIHRLEAVTGNWCSLPGRN